MWVNDLGYTVFVWDVSRNADGERTQKLVWHCPFHEVWASMRTRCCGKSFKKRRPTYEFVDAVGSWKVASNFKLWMCEQDWKGKQLDKDIIVPSNKMYSPETCAFVLPLTNRFVLARDKMRGEFPIGVHFYDKNGKFQAYCNNPFTHKRYFLGYHNSPLDAHEAWRKQKHELAQLVAATETDPRVVEALKKRYSYEEWYKHNPI